MVHIYLISYNWRNLLLLFVLWFEIRLGNLLFLCRNVFNVSGIELFSAININNYYVNIC